MNVQRPKKAKPTGFFWVSYNLGWPHPHVAGAGLELLILLHPFLKCTQDSQSCQMVAPHSFNPSSGETNAGRFLWVQGLVYIARPSLKTQQKEDNTILNLQVAWVDISPKEINGQSTHKPSSWLVLREMPIKAHWNTIPYPLRQSMTIIKRQTRGQTEGPISEMLAVKAWKPQFNPWDPCKLVHL